MTGYITDYSGKTSRLPELLSWEINHAAGTPCDAFEVKFLYDSSMLRALSDATRFKAAHNEETVFCGVVDEFSVAADKRGAVVELEGRSLAALLLDNEAEAAEYFNVGLDFILGKHVYPYGVAELRAVDMKKASHFTVTSGTSNWNVLCEFARFCGGVEPRISRDGVLLLNGETGSELAINAATPVIQQTYRGKRYGVISSVTVKNKVRGTVSTVKNQDFADRGGNRRRVVNVPRYTEYDMMRYTGEYQIQQSEKDYLTCAITLPELFAAFPGDIVRLIQGPLEGISGTFSVTETRCWANGGDFGTDITMTRQGA